MLISKLVGKTVCVAVQLPDGTHNYHLGELVAYDQLYLEIKRVCWVKDTGRHGEFFHGKFDSNAEIEVYDESVSKFLPLWGSEITEYPFDIPKESV